MITLDIIGQQIKVGDRVAYVGRIRNKISIGVVIGIKRGGWVTIEDPREELEGCDSPPLPRVTASDNVVKVGVKRPLSERPLSDAAHDSRYVIKVGESPWDRIAYNNYPSADYHPGPGPLTGRLRFIVGRDGKRVLQYSDWPYCTHYEDPRRGWIDVPLLAEQE